MTTIQGMPPFSTSSTDSLMENKGGFLWPDNHPPPEGTSGGHGPGSFLGGVDFFDEFVVLDGTDSLASSSSSGAERDRGRGGRFKAEAVTPPSISGGAAISGGSAMLPPGRMQQQQQQSGGRSVAAMDAHHLDMIDMGGLPPHYRDGPGMGSISDSELLRLEGLTMRSPRVHMAPSSSSMPPSPTPRSAKAASPRKTGRLEALYVKARDKMATMQGKVRSQHPQISTARMEPAKRRAARSNGHANGNGYPLSPPLSGSLPDGLPSATDTNNMIFGSNPLDDLFSGTHLLGNGNGNGNVSAQLSSGAMPNTPLATPLAANGFPATAVGGVEDWHRFADPAVLHSFSSTDAFLWDAAATDTMDIDDPNFFLTSSDRASSSSTAGLQLPMRHLHHGTFDLLPGPGAGGEPSGLMIHMPQTRSAAPSVLHASYQMAISQNHQQQPSFHYPPPPPVLSGGSCSRHRRGPPPPVATTNDANPSPRRPKPRAPSSGARHHHYAPSQSSPRKTSGIPSSSSSGSVPASPSPGTTTNANNAIPRGLHRRSASMQLLRSSDPHHPPPGMPPSTSTSALRKRKSWTTSRRVSDTLEPPIVSPRKTSQHHHRRSASHSSHRPTASSSSAGGGGAGAVVRRTRSSQKLRSSSSSTATFTSTSSSHRAIRTNNSSHNHSPDMDHHHGLATTTPNESNNEGNRGGGTMSFVNYTPQDHKVLMRGVAPSGSSKTKARRDREAAEQKRKLGEAVRLAVAAAGGDIEKLDLAAIGVGSLGGIDFDGLGVSVGNLGGLNGLGIGGLGEFGGGGADAHGLDLGLGLGCADGDGGGVDLGMGGADGSALLGGDGGGGGESPGSSSREKRGVLKGQGNATRTRAKAAGRRVSFG